MKQIKNPSLPKLTLTEARRTALKKYKNQRDRLARAVRKSGGKLTANIPTTARLASVSTQNVKKLTRQLSNFTAQDARQLFNSVSSSTISSQKQSTSATVSVTQEEIARKNEQRETARIVKQAQERAEEQRTHRKRNLRRQERGYKRLIDAIENDRVLEYLGNVDAKNQRRLKRQNREWIKYKQEQEQGEEQAEQTEQSSRRTGEKRERRKYPKHEDNRIPVKELVEEEYRRVQFERERRKQDEEEKQRLEESEEEQADFSEGKLVYQTILGYIDNATYKNRASKLNDLLNEQIEHYGFDIVMISIETAPDEMIEASSKLCYSSETQSEADAQMMTIAEIITGEVIPDEMNRELSDEKDEQETFDSDNPFTDE